MASPAYIPYLAIPYLSIMTVAYANPHPSVLEKVKAHDAAVLNIRHPKAVGNNHADHWVKQAATTSALETWAPALPTFGDAVEQLDCAGHSVLDALPSFRSAWWQRSRRIS